MIDRNLSRYVVCLLAVCVLMATGACGHKQEANSPAALTPDARGRMPSEQANKLAGHQGLSTPTAQNID